MSQPRGNSNCIPFPGYHMICSIYSLQEINVFSILFTPAWQQGQLHLCTAFVDAITMCWSTNGMPMFNNNFNDMTGLHWFTYNYINLHNWPVRMPVCFKITIWGLYFSYFNIVSSKFWLHFMSISTICEWIQFQCLIITANWRISWGPVLITRCIRSYNYQLCYKWSLYADNLSLFIEFLHNQTYMSIFFVRVGNVFFVWIHMIEPYTYKNWIYLIPQLHMFIASSENMFKGLLIYAWD